MQLPIVPAPVSLTAPTAPPFGLTAATRVVGDADAARALIALVHARTGLALRRADAADAAPADSAPADAAPSIALRVEAGGAAESYRIAADEASVTVTGGDSAGLFYGVQTLGQLVAPAPAPAPAPGGGGGWVVPAVRIEDAPRFGYRGVMLDVARHFHGVETVKACIDRAASLKLNHLHLHLTDDQGWRLQLRTRPLLTERGSATAIGGDGDGDGGGGGFYSPEDFAEIVAHAASRHVTVVPEIDVPGHTHAVSLAYPALCEPPVLSAHVREVAAAYGGGLPENGTPYEGLAVGFSSLRIRDEATWEFLADVLGEVAGLTPGPYLHIGGDEALGTDPADYAWFVDRVTALVARLGKTPVAWHEAGASAGLDPTTVGQYWGFVTPTEGMDEKTRSFVRSGSRVILSPADAVYLDMKWSADAPLGLTWANGPTGARRAYEWEPARVVDGVGEADILGVEAALWTERPARSPTSTPWRSRASPPRPRRHGRRRRARAPCARGNRSPPAWPTSARCGRGWASGSRRCPRSPGPPSPP